MGKVLGGRFSYFLVCTSQMAILKKLQKTSTGAIKSKVRALTESICFQNVETLKIVVFPMQNAIFFKIVILDDNVKNR